MNLTPRVGVIRASPEWRPVYCSSEGSPDPEVVRSEEMPNQRERVVA